MTEVDNKTRTKQAAELIRKSAYDPATYEYDPSFKPWDGNDPLGVHTTAELLQCLERNKEIEVDARLLFLGKNKEGKVESRVGKSDRKLFLESFKRDAAEGVTLREGYLSGGYFNTNGSIGNTLVGQDFTPLTGGPFYKNLYFYQDYIRMHAEAFFAYHNDPFAHAITQITRDFVLGTGYEVQCDTSDNIGKLAMVAWKSFEEANDFQEQLDQACTEQSIYGEIMFWELPNNQAKIVYDLSRTDTNPIAVIPRVRLIDPSNIVEIVTYPEDLTRPLFYVWLQPTQYQIYTSGLGNNLTSPTPIQPTLKFIYQQIPASQMKHFKINAVSNEKRGRSDYFPVFSYSEAHERLD